jgi:hypothetical protein
VSARAGIVVTGTEVLTGRVSDRNGPWLSDRLRELGVDLAHIAIVGVVLALIVLLVVGLIGKGGGSGSSSKTAGQSSSKSIKKTSKAHAGKHAKKASGASSQGTVVALSLRATAPVYVCLIGDKGHVRIPGEELQAGTSTSTYHSRRFLVTLGNSSVKMFVDGH